MKIKKQYIITGLVLIVVFITGFLYINLNKEKESLPVISIEQNQAKDDLSSKTQTEKLIPKIEKEENLQISTDTNNIKISLIVVDKKYDTNIKEGASVFEAMEKIEKESTNENVFNFKYTNNASLGNFITEINGQYGTPGKYWIYYVNNKKASVGVSNYILKEGDIINWAQEGI